MYIQERNFVKIARQQMGVLEAIWSLDTADSAHGTAGAQTIGALGHIRSSAHSVQARGVVRAAMLCEDIFARLGAKGAIKLRSALVSLQNLIAQYSEGLFEIDPDFKAMLTGKKIGNSSKHIGNDPVIDAQEKAVSVLSPLLKFIRKPAHLSALKSLMGQNPETLDMPAAGVARFDAIMRPVTNLCLGEARLDGKNVSVSYASDFETLGRHTANELQHLMEHLLLHITAQSIGPDGGQISLTAQKQTGPIEISILWNGAQLAEEFGAHTRLAKAVSKLAARGGSINVHKAGLSDVQDKVQALDIVFPEILQSVDEQGAETVNIFDLNTERESIA